MIATVLLQHPWVTPGALLLVVLLAPFLGARLSTRPRVAWWLAAVSLVPVAVLTLVPVQRELYARCTVQWALPTPGRVELVANVLLFVGPALLVGVAGRRPWAAFLAASGVSVLVEVVQALLPALGRSCDTTDWLSNSLGALLGAVLAVAALALARRTDLPPG